MKNNELIDNIINGNAMFVSKEIKKMSKTSRFIFLRELKESSAITENELWCWIQKIVEVNL